MKNLIKMWIALCTCIGSAVILPAQIVALRAPESEEVVIGNMVVSKDAKNVVVEYKLLFGNAVESCNVELNVSLDGGRKFQRLTKGLKGDVGRISKDGVKRLMIPLDVYSTSFAGKQMELKLTVDEIVIRGKHLTADGTANCYIVSQKGTYCFPTVKGNSSKSVGDVASAHVLWESFGTSVAPSVGDLIKSVSYADGTVSFRTADTFKEGNAVIAVKDASGTILWSWHIWLTEYPQEQEYFNNAGIMMDRNLGATSATPGDVGALGLLYQWGRKDPFPGSSSIDSLVIAESTTVRSSIPSFKATGTIAFAISHPTTFILENEENWDWYYSRLLTTDKTRWRSSKTIYDPCPPGWRVPDGGRGGVWSNALRSSPYLAYEASLYNETNEGMNFSSKLGSSSTIWYPAAGYYYDGVENVGDTGYYWSVSSGSYERFEYFWQVEACCFLFSSNGTVRPHVNYSRSHAMSVRCQKE